MGLDMYLSKKTYVKNWNHTPKEGQYEVTVKKNGKLVKGINPERISYIEEEVAYWRKANQIHNWFVDNTAEGIDNCQSSYVSEENLRELFDNCIKVRDSLIKSDTTTEQVKSGWSNGEKIFDEVQVYTDTSLAQELLPSSSGFLFGSTLYGEYYLEVINNTIEILEEIFKDVNEEGYLNGEYYYCASW